MEANMNEQSNQNNRESQTAAVPDVEPHPVPGPPVTESSSQPQSTAGEREDDEEDNPSKEEDELVAKAQKLMEKITSSPDNPNQSVLHALASILETQESRRYMKDNDYSSSSSAPASHNVGRLGNLIRENDDFFELISSKYLSKTRYPISIQAAAARLLLSCSLTWIYPHVFEEPGLESIQTWVMDNNAICSSEEQNKKHDSGTKDASDADMLKRHATGLLAVCLAG